VAAGFDSFFITACLSSAWLAKLGFKRISEGSDVQNIEHEPVYRVGFALYIELTL
jgi:hypothetical protein